MSVTNNRRPILWAALTYTILVGLLTLPHPRQLSDHLLGNNIDNWIFYWDNWWLRQAITNGHSWFFTTDIFFPQGTSLVAHSNSFLNSLFAFVLQPLDGPVLAYNLVLLLGLWVGAVGTFLFVRDLTGKAWPAWLAGVVFALAPYHVTRVLAQSHLGSIHWWPWYAWALHRLLTKERWREALLAGLFTALTLWSGLQLALLLGMWTAVYLLYHLWQTKRLPLRQLLLLGGVALLLSWPMLHPLLREWQTITAATSFGEGDNSQTDLLAYFTPPTYHPLWGAAMVDTYERFEVNRAFMPYLGYGALLLALLAAWRQRKLAGFWLASGGLWLLLALGTAVRINGRLYPITLPYTWLENVFPISAMRSPDRFNLLLIFSLAVLVGLGAAELARWRYGRWLLLAAAAMLLLEYAIYPVPAWELPPDSPALTEMAQDGGEYAVVDYPMGYTLSKLWLYYQTRHGKPIVEGHVSRYTAETYAFIAHQPILQRLYMTAVPPAQLSIEQITPDQPLVALGPALRDLQAAGVGKILLHRPYADVADLAQFQAVLPLIPVYEDEALAVYDLANPRPWQYGEAVSLPNAITLLQSWQTVTDGRLHLRLLTRLDGNVAGPMNCETAVANQSAALTLYPAGADWQRGDLASQEVSLPLPAAEGLYPITLTCEGTVYMLPDQIAINEGTAVLLHRSLGLQYGDAITLSSYRTWTTGSDLTVALHWQAVAAPIAEYKVFVHLLAADGAIVRQYDALPCNWACPTSGWQPGQAINDEATLLLAGLPPGTYSLAVGLYDAATGERPSVTAPNGSLIPDGYFVLPENLRLEIGD